MERNRSWRFALVAVLAVFATALTTSPAGAADFSPTTIKTFEKLGYVPGPGGGLVLNWGFDPRTAMVHHGTYIRIVNTSTSGEAHTASVVRAADVPKTIDDIFACFAPDSVCGKILARHDPGNDGKPPFNKLVNSGPDGFNQAGDSRLMLPGTSALAKITAPAGTTLHYICAIHPWMQAKIKVT